MYSTIKTPITETGELAIGRRTSLSALMTIGAMYHTVRRSRQGLSIQTDDEGLGTLANVAEGAMSSICMSLEAIGDLLINVDAKELSEGTIENFGWLLASLGEIGLQVEDARTLIGVNIMERTQSARARATRPRFGGVFVGREWSPERGFVDCGGTLHVIDYL